MRPADANVSLTGTTVEQRVTALEGRLARLEKLLSLSADGSVTVNAPKISLQAPFIEMKAANAISIEGASWIALKSVNAITVKTGGLFDVASSGVVMKTDDLALMSSGVAAMKAPTLILNNGTRPLARVGDAITANGAPSGMAGVIASNGSTVLG